jgi:hypothetical protein
MFSVLGVRKMTQYFLAVSCRTSARFVPQAVEMSSIIFGSMSIVSKAVPL